MSRLFGTDGIRGLANRDLTPELALAVAQAGARVLGSKTSVRPTAVVGRDTRVSGEFLSAATVSGLAAAGVDVWDVGVVPTPAVAYLTDSSDADFGVMLSASHNPMPDNGIKFFAKGGKKLPDEVEDRIEAQLDSEDPGPTGAEVGRVRPGGAPLQDYVDHVVSTIPHRLDGLHVVVDAANGAASEASPLALRSLGATVTLIHGNPDGYNINDNCGSTHMEDLVAAVSELGADAGIAHDGDADRCLAVDADGNLIDGDQIMAILALAMKDASNLAQDTVVATVMSNLGFKIAMQQNGVSVAETAVGDRYVLEAMQAGSFNLGGEQSGHVLLLDHATTGDGVMTAAHLLSRMAQTGRSLADLAGVMQRLPQVLINVAGVDKAALPSNEALTEAVRLAEAALGDNGRVLLRPSGTEPLVRVMVEAVSYADAERVASDLANIVEAELGLSR